MWGNFGPIVRKIIFRSSVLKDLMRSEGLLDGKFVCVPQRDYLLQIFEAICDDHKEPVTYLRLR